MNRIVSATTTAAPCVPGRRIALPHQPRPFCLVVFLLLLVLFTLNRAVWTLARERGRGAEGARAAPPTAASLGVRKSGVFCLALGSLFRCATATPSVGRAAPFRRSISRLRFRQLALLLRTVPSGGVTACVTRCHLSCALKIKNNPRFFLFDFKLCTKADVSVKLGFERQFQSSAN